MITLRYESTCHKTRPKITKLHGTGKTTEFKSFQLPDNMAETTRFPPITIQVVPKTNAGASFRRQSTPHAKKNRAIAVNLRLRLRRWNKTIQPFTDNGRPVLPGMLLGPLSGGGEIDRRRVVLNPE